MTPERLQERFARAPELAELVAGLDARAEPAELFFARSEAFAALLRSSALRELVRHELAALVAEPTRSVQDSYEGTWILAADPRFELALATVPEDGDGAVLHGSPRHRLIAAFWPEAVEVELFRHTQAHPPDVFDRSVALESLGGRTLRRGEVLQQRAWSDVVEPRISAAPAYLLVFASAPTGHLRWTYERASLRPLRPTPASLAANHLEYAIGTLLHLGHPDAAEVLAGLTAHPAHHVRWSAIRAVMEIDRQRGAALLAKALDDPHPHVRAAARRGLDACESTEE